MADLTLLDVARLQGADEEVGVIEENLKAAPELATIPFKLIKGTSYLAVIRAALAQGSFRDANTGSAAKKSTWTNKKVECYFYDQILKCDEMVKKANQGEMIDLFAEEESGGFIGMGQYISTQTYYGRSNGGDAKGFPGFLDVLDSTMVVDAAGTGSATTSAWLAHLGKTGVRYVGGNEEIPKFGEWLETMLQDGSSNPYRGWFNNISGYIGLQLGHSKSVCRIKNITAAKPLTYALISKAWSLFPAGMKPNAIFVNSNGWQTLQASLTATTPTGLPAPFPEEAFKMPIIVTDGITSTEVAA